MSNGIDKMGENIASMILERKKQKTQEAQTSLVLNSLEDRISQTAKTPEEVEAFHKTVDSLRKAKLSVAELSTVGKAIAPDLFQDDLTRAIKENSKLMGDEKLQQAQQQNAMSSIPIDLPTLKQDSTPEEKTAFLDKLNPQLAANVQAVANYELDPKSFPLRSGERSALFAATKKYDPSFDQKLYPTQQAYMKEMASNKRGTIGGTINSANTLVAHLDLLDQQVDKLKNTNLKPQNAVVNLAKQITGDSSITDFEQAKAVVDSELEVLLSGVGATQQGLAARRTLLSENAGYDQMKSAIKTIGHVLQARTHPMEQQYESLFKKPAGDTILHADSKATLDRFYAGDKSSKKKSYSSLWS